MELYWYQNNELKCRVHLKPNQTLKYLNKSSTHQNCTFKAIPKSTIKRLAQLTSLTSENEHKTIDELYPDHARALRYAKLAPKKFPTLKEAQEQNRIESEAKATTKVNPDDSP